MAASKLIMTIPVRKSVVLRKSVVEPDFMMHAPRGFWARGALCMAVSTLIMTTSALCVKLIDGRVPLFEVVVRARWVHIKWHVCPTRHTP